MGPEKTRNRTCHPRFECNIQTTLFNDGCGIQEGNAHSVKLWDVFYDNLSKNYPTENQPDLLGIFLKSELFLRAYQIFSGLSDKVTDDGTTAIVASIFIFHQLNVTLSVINDFAI